MNIENLTRMANRIGEFFAAYPDQVEARREIASHLRRFWEPRMRRALLLHLEQTGGAGLDALVLAAVKEHRSELEPKVAA